MEKSGWRGLTPNPSPKGEGNVQQCKFSDGHGKLLPMSSMTECKRYRPRSQRSAIGRLYANCKEGRDRSQFGACRKSCRLDKVVRYASCMKMPMGHTSL